VPGSTLSPKAPFSSDESDPTVGKVRQEEPVVPPARGVLGHGARRGARGMLAGGGVKLTIARRIAMPRSLASRPRRACSLGPETPHAAVDGAEALQEPAWAAGLRRAINEERAVRPWDGKLWRPTPGAGSAAGQDRVSGAWRRIAVIARGRGAAMPTLEIAGTRPPLPGAGTSQRPAA
jgi:hypothetical protein